jgi:predicted ATPase
MIHLEQLNLIPEQFPNQDAYPFNLAIFQKMRRLQFKEPVTFFVGENGTGKSTLLRALAIKSGIHIWEDKTRTRLETNHFKDDLYKTVDLSWAKGVVPGSFFGSQIFQHFAQMLDEWAKTDPGMLEYFGGQSLMTQSHGQSLMSFFSSRYQLKGIYYLDEPETALSPKSQIQLLKLIYQHGFSGEAQFVIASHSPILLACPGATIYSFDDIPVKTMQYEDTAYYRVYKDFLENREHFLADIENLD